jgi:hypothetical protein
VERVNKFFAGFFTLIGKMIPITTPTDKLRKEITHAASRRRDKRQILCVGRYTNGYYLKPSLEEALACGT